MLRYRNKFYDRTNPISREYFECDRLLEIYKGFALYEYMPDQIHAVKDGVCVAMCAGVRGMKDFIDKGGINGELLE